MDNDNDDDDGAERRRGRKDRLERTDDNPHISDTDHRRNVRPIKPRHFLEDEDDRAMAKYFGAGRARARDEHRQTDRLRAAVLRQVLMVLHGGAVEGAHAAPHERAPWADLAVVAVDVRRGGTVEVTFALAEGEGSAALAARLAAALQRELAAHVPRRRTPVVRVRLVPLGCDPEGPR